MTNTRRQDKEETRDVIKGINDEEKTKQKNKRNENMKTKNLKIKEKTEQDRMRENQKKKNTKETMEGGENLRKKTESLREIKDVGSTSKPNPQDWEEFTFQTQNGFVQVSKLDVFGKDSPDLNIQGKDSPGLNIQGEVSPDLNIQGEVSPDLNIQGEVSPDLNIQGEVSPEDETGEYLQKDEFVQGTKPRENSCSIFQVGIITTVDKNLTEEEYYSSPKSLKCIWPGKH